MCRSTIPAARWKKRRKPSASAFRRIQVPSTPAGDKSPGHPELDPFWSLLAETGTPFVLHIGAGSRVLPPAYTNFGKPRAPDLHGGGENLRFKDYVVLPHSAEMFLAALVYDGLFDRLPELSGGVIEYGAYWVPGFLRQMDMGARSFGRTDPYLQALSAKPSEIIRRHVKFTPFPGEDAGYLIRDSGADLYMFSSDYPHPEGTNDPIGRFERTFTELTEGRSRAVLREELRADDGRAASWRWPEARRCSRARGRQETSHGNLDRARAHKEPGRACPDAGRRL